VFSIAQAAFFGLGAYTAALLAVNCGISFWLCVTSGMILSAVISVLISIPSLRLHDDFFAIATFAFQVVVFNVFNDLMSVTRGPLGIPGIPNPKVFGISIKSHLDFFILVASFAAASTCVVWLITTSPFGRVLRAIREDQDLPLALGKNALRFKVVAFAVSGALAATAGALYAYYITYIDPTSFTVMESILILSMVIVGGAASLWGPVVGAAVLVVLPEALRFVGMPVAVAANVRRVVYGLLLVIMMIFRPRGLVGRYGFRR
jgi:branched-chain amino acid transport system permease protein